MKIKSTYLATPRAPLNVLGTNFPENKHTHLYTYSYIWNHTCMCVQLLSGDQLFVTPWTIARRAPLSIEFSSKKWVSVSYSREAP